MKIAIIGSCGSGKTTLAKELHNKLNIPLYLLDDYFWKPGWQEPERIEFKKIHDNLCDKDEWIIEGMFTSNLEYRIQKADSIIFLDPPVAVCVYRIFKRALLNTFKSITRSHMLGCLKYTWKFNQTKRSIVDALFDKYKDSKQVFIVKNATELDFVLKTLR
jgi:adenylate kinase family enzyme